MSVMLLDVCLSKTNDHNRLKNLIDVKYKNKTVEQSTTKNSNVYTKTITINKRTFPIEVSNIRLYGWGSGPLTYTTKAIHM